MARVCNVVLSFGRKIGIDQTREWNSVTSVAHIRTDNVAVALVYFAMEIETIWRTQQLNRFNQFGVYRYTRSPAAAATHWKLNNRPPIGNDEQRVGTRWPCVCRVLVLCQIDKRSRFPFKSDRRKKKENKIIIFIRRCFSLRTQVGHQFNISLLFRYTHTSADDDSRGPVKWEMT